MNFQKSYKLIPGVFIFTIIACNLQTTQIAPTVAIEITATLPSASATTISLITPKPSETLQATVTPTATFTPMAIQQLAFNTYFNYTQPLNTSTPHADPNTITGTIYNGYGSIANASVSISNSSCGVQVMRTTTNDKGQYTFTNIKPGKYYMEINEEKSRSICGEEIIKIAGVGLSKDLILPRNYLRITGPNEGQVVSASGAKVEWEPVSDAAYYIVQVTVQVSGDPGWKGNWQGNYIGTWLMNTTSFIFPNDLSQTKDYRATVIAYSIERLPLAQADVQFRVP